VVLLNIYCDGQATWHGWRDASRFWWGKVTDRNKLEDLSVDGRIILKCISKQKLVVFGVDKYGL